MGVDTMEKERFRKPHPQLYSQGYQSVQVMPRNNINNHFL